MPKETWGVKGRHLALDPSHEVCPAESPGGERRVDRVGRSVGTPNLVINTVGSSFPERGTAVVPVPLPVAEALVPLCWVTG